MLRPAAVAPAFRILLGQFASVVVLLLVAAAIISLVLGDRLEAAAIGVALAINTLVGFAVELRARRAMDALSKLDAPEASVLRDGHLQRIAVASLVPGDIIELTAGHSVPADARLIAATEVRASEAPLTGESFPVPKHHDVTLADATPLAERANMVYKATTIATGAARAIVTATGQSTEIGRIGTLVSAIREERTPLERRLDTLGRRLVWGVLGVAAIVAALGIIHDTPAMLVLQIGVALAVAAVPEGLPAVATIALAVGLHRMARRDALVRRLPAVEALGSATIVCTDKTRTLTSGEMTVVVLWIADRYIDLRDPAEASRSAGDVQRALEIAVRASRPQPVVAPESRRAIGDPVDAAVLSAASAAGLDPDALLADPRTVAIVPFSSERRLAAAFGQRNGGVIAFVKGAPQRVLASCDRRLTHDGEREIDLSTREDLLEVNQSLAARGLRVLALATGVVTAPLETALSDLTFVGLVGLTDPPAPGVKATIERLRRAGLRTIVLTGDQPLTAQAVGRELGLLDRRDRAVEGHELDRWSDDELRSRLRETPVFSRITPAHKLRIVTALQARGEIVAMLGDGVNDAPALKKADIGVAMGVRGTDVAKEAAAIVLRSDRFETIAAAVEEGRVIFDNIRKFVFYLFSCNAAEVLVLLVAGAIALPVPLLPLQILWLNMVTDTLPALALAMEPGDADIMDRPPRDPQEAILSRAFLIHIMVYATLITASTLAAFAVGLRTSHGKAVTLSFMTLALAQILHLGNARSEAPVLHPRRAGANLFAVAAVLVAVGLQIASVAVEPLARLLRLDPLTASDWTAAVCLAALPAFAGQAAKLRRQRLRPSDSGTASTGSWELHITR